MQTETDVLDKMLDLNRYQSTSKLGSSTSTAEIQERLENFQKKLETAMKHDMQAQVHFLRFHLFSSHLSKI
jgi:hypothetical protein